MEAKIKHFPEVCRLYAEELCKTLATDVSILSIENKELKKPLQWIKSSEQLPEFNVSVLCFIPEEDNHITTGMWDVSNKWVLLDEYRVPNSQITYWMPMPVIKPEDLSFEKKFDSDDRLNNTSNLIRNLQYKNFLLEKSLKKANEFKKYVHDRLDEAGIEKDPESPHKEHGCRIGGRLDIVLNKKP